MLDKHTLPYWEHFRHSIAERAKPRPQAVTLAGGEETNSYMDLKGYFINGYRLRRLAECMLTYRAMVLHRGVTAVGGPTMGADFISHAMCNQFEMLEWFSVRTEPKDHGLGRHIEGASLDVGYHVVLVDDAVNSGNSLLKAAEVVASTGAEIVAAIPLVDLSGKAEPFFKSAGIPYHPLYTHQELGIDPL